MTQSKTLAALILIAVAVAGGATGYALATMAPWERGPHREGRSPRIKFARDLSLTDAQKQAMDSLMDRQRRAIAELYAPVRPQMDSLARSRDSIVGRSQAELRALLTPEQRQRFDRMRAEARKRFRVRGGRHGRDALIMIRERVPPPDSR